MRGPNTNRLESFGSVGKAFGKPVQVGRLARHLLGLLASDLCAAANRKWVLGIGVVIRVVVVRPLDVEAEVDDGPVLPADVLGVRRVPAALGGFARQRQRLPAEALIAGGEELPLVSAARSGRNRTASRAVPSPAVRPVVVAGDPDQWAGERIEVGDRRRVEAVAAGPSPPDFRSPSKIENATLLLLMSASRLGYCERPRVL
jgi:hypothetical protein